MRILYYSDLHLEHRNDPDALFANFPSPEQFDVIVAAGDIFPGIEVINWLRKYSAGKPVIYVPGNHCYYGNNYDQLQTEFRTASEGTNIHVLNPGTIVIDGVTFIGATMWSNLALLGYRALQDWQVARSIADFRVISTTEGLFTPYRMRQINLIELNYVSDVLSSTQNNSKTVVVTHFVPTQQCTAEKYKNNPINPYFINDHDFLMDQFHYPLHIFGHTHDQYDKIHTSGTRLLCNPSGYPNEHSYPYQWKIIEL